ncbi:MAG TPA: hypothetical protein VMU30_12895 [Bacteroidota bacterium]|nr:hypothetical protein [Bacteroidota bacterium]
MTKGEVSQDQIRALAVFFGLSSGAGGIYITSLRHTITELQNQTSTLENRTKTIKASLEDSLVSATEEAIKKSPRAFQQILNDTFQKYSHRIDDAHRRINNISLKIASFRNEPFRRTDGSKSSTNDLLFLNGIKDRVDGTSTAYYKELAISIPPENH